MSLPLTKLLLTFATLSFLACASAEEPPGSSDSGGSFGGSALPGMGGSSGSTPAGNGGTSTGGNGGTSASGGSPGGAPGGGASGAPVGGTSSGGVAGQSGGGEAGTGGGGSDVAGGSAGEGGASGAFGGAGGGGTSGSAGDGGKGGGTMYIPCEVIDCSQGDGICKEEPNRECFAFGGSLGSACGYFVDSDDLCDPSVQFPVPAPSGSGVVCVECKEAIGSGGSAGSGGGSQGIFPLLFSEYIEGTSNNKAIEIMNLSGDQTVSLADCILERYSNGASKPGAKISLADAGSLAPGGIVTLCNPQGAIPQGQCTIKNSDLNHNGNDALVLLCQGKIIDSIGQVGKDPGEAWSGNGVSTKDQTLIRKCSVNAGDADPTNPFDPSQEWGSKGMDAFQDLGNKSCLN
jgi:hypothetical protein